MKKILMTALGVLLLVTLANPAQAAQKATTKYVSAGLGIGAPAAGGPTGPINFNDYPVIFISGAGDDEDEKGTIKVSSTGMEVDLKAPEDAERGAIISNEKFKYKCDYDVQVKPSAGSGTDHWNVGIVFNLDSPASGTPHGYGLTFFNYWNSEDLSAIIPNFPSSFKDKPVVLLWQNHPDSGRNWIAYARVDATGPSVMSGGLTYSGEKWYLDSSASVGQSGTPPTLVVKVVRTSTGNQIRAYLGGPTDQGNINIKIPTDYVNRRGYAIWGSTPVNDIKWPPFNGTWSPDYFTMLYSTNTSPTTPAQIQWVKNPAITGVTLSSDTTTTGSAISNAVITSDAFTDKEIYNRVGLFVDGTGNPWFRFTDLGIKESCSSTPTCSAVSIDTASLPNGVRNQSYSTTVTANGGKSPYTWSAENLPPGLTIGPTTGTISGTPSGEAKYNPSYSPTVTVTDSCPTAGSKTYSNITIYSHSSYNVRNETGHDDFYIKGGSYSSCTQKTDGNTFNVYFTDTTPVNIYRNNSCSTAASLTYVNYQQAAATDAGDNDNDNEVQVNDSWNLVGR